LKLCVARVPTCPGLRHAYITNLGSSIKFDNILDGEYELRYVQTKNPPYITAISKPLVISEGKVNEYYWNIPREPFPKGV
ncbi:hypothetical protein QN347_20770, partial [Sphingomonas sp. 10B4]|nr:hypothetical protein [Sphingomonas sp. 10B4]